MKRYILVAFMVVGLVIFLEVKAEYDAVNDEGAYKGVPLSVGNYNPQQTVDLGELQPAAEKEEYERYEQ